MLSLPITRLDLLKLRYADFIHQVIPIDCIASCCYTRRTAKLKAAFAKSQKEINGRLDAIGMMKELVEA